MSDKPKPVAWESIFGQMEYLYTASAIRWWLERAAQECDWLAKYAYNESEHGRECAEECAAAIRAVMKEVE